MNKSFFIRSFGAFLVILAPAVASAAGNGAPTTPTPGASVQVGPIQAGKAPVTAPQTPNRQFNAWAKPAGLPGGGGPLPSLRKQIGADAHVEGMWQKGTSLRMHDNGNGTVTATLYAKSTFGGGPSPIAPTRLSYASATYRVNQVMEGQIATPVKVDGAVWQRVMRAVAPTREIPEQGGVAGPIGSPTPNFHALTGPTGKPFVRGPNGSLWSSVTEHDHIGPNDLPPAQEPGHITAGVVSGPTGLQFYRDASGALFHPINMKQDGLHTGDLPPVQKP